MNPKTLLAVTLTMATVFSAGDVYADTKPQEFQACLKRTEHDRMTCQSGCGMILQQCYDEAEDALTKKTDVLLANQRSTPCSALAKKYADGSAQLASAIENDAESQPGWLSAELKMQLMQQRYDAVSLIDKMCK